MKTKIILAAIILFSLPLTLSSADRRGSSPFDFHLYPYLNIGSAKSIKPDHWWSNHLYDYNRSSYTDFGYGINFDLFLKNFGIGFDCYNNHIHSNNFFDYFFSSTTYHINYKDINGSLFYRYIFDYDDARCFFKFGAGPDYVIYRISYKYYDSDSDRRDHREFGSNSPGYHLNADFCVDYGYFSFFIGFNYMRSKLGSLKDTSDDTYLDNGNSKKIDVTLTAKTVRFGFGINI